MNHFDLLTGRENGQNKKIKVGGHGYKTVPPGNVTFDRNREEAFAQLVAFEGFETENLISARNYDQKFRFAGSYCNFWNMA